jgi:hypothetical protein
MMGYNPQLLPHALASSPVPAVEECVHLLQKAQEEIIACHNITMQRMAEQSHGVKYMPWRVGDKIWLSAKNLIVPIPKKKLGLKIYGPFPIKAILSPITFTLQLPEQWRIHPTFHTSKLSSYCKTDVHGPNFQEPPPDVIAEEEEYEVEAILAHKGMGKQRHYLVSWTGYSSASNKWIPEENLGNASEITKAYKKKYKLV